MCATVNNEYNANDDFSKSIEECYRVIRERVKNGGPTWRPRGMSYTITKDANTLSVRATIWSQDEMMLFISALLKQQMELPATVEPGKTHDRVQPLRAESTADLVTASIGADQTPAQGSEQKASEGQGRPKEPGPGDA